MTAAGGTARRALVATLLLVAAACTGDDGGAPTTTTDPPPAGVIRLGLADPIVVDPLDASLASPSDLMVLDLLHDGLTRLDAEGNPQPALAEGWRANATQTAFRFALDPSATFASGRPVSTDDVIASLERVMASGDTSLSALSLEAVEGFAEFATGAADHVSGLTAPDEHSVRVALSTPLSVLPWVLSNPLLGVVDVGTIDGDVDALDLSGGWTISAAGDAGVELGRRNGGATTLEGVELRHFGDEDAAYDAFERGQVDWAGVPPDRVQQARADHGDELFAPFHAEVFFGLNVHSPALENGFFRKAIQLAIDREAIVDEVYRELADPLTTVVPAGVAGHDPERCPSCAPDPEQAADIVAQLYPDGDAPTVHLDFDESEPQLAMAALVASDLEAAGIPTELRPLPLDEYKEFVVSGDQELFSFGWIGAYGSPDAFLAPLFGSSANDNLTGFSSRAVDGYLQRARAGADGAKNHQRWALAERDVLAGAVVVPIAQFRTQAVASDRVEGLVHAVDGTVDWTEVSVSR